jgi:hypothetical protein
VKDGLNDLDQTHAVFAALGSFWWRLLVFFLCFWLGHYIGLNAYTGGEFLRSVWQNGPSALFQHGDLNPIVVPLSWFWTLLSGCAHPLGMLYLFVLATAFLIVRLSEDHFMHGFLIGLLVQPLHTVFVEWRDSGALADFDLVVTVIVLVTYEVVIGGLYWWYLRQLR